MSQALSTGKIAKYCFVTGDTVQNWIRSGILPAQRTAGGQYRVRVEDLREFMVERDMSVQELDSDCQRAPERLVYCWEYYQKSARRHVGAKRSCDKCVVKRTLSLKCYELRKHVDHGCLRCRGDCATCAYYRKYAQADG